MKRRVLSDLLVIRHPIDFLRETLKVSGLKEHAPAGVVVTAAYHMAVRLYRGEFDGYFKCDTNYHDFAHAAETLLTMARLIHGAQLASKKIAQRDLAVGLTAAILHDAGYIRTSAESTEKGACFRAEHEMRSMAFVLQHGEAIGLTPSEIAECQTMIQSTMMTEDVNAMSFQSGTHELLARMLSVSDLLAQLSSATYLERLFFLYEEDRDSGAPGYQNPLDCCRKAISFDERARARLKNNLEQADVYLVNHFNARWHTPGNLYRISMDRQLKYLTGVVEQDGFDPRCHLRRWGSVKALRGLLAENRIATPG
ncbi:MAG: hypothetical protein HF981_09185 [Desulfobacteraceae bacterium]|nr:hypothetical protein [Desulfobacteraceae bacterium]MBC2750544.1 hypothetical protein [Desulfobacteraceae bacterium]